MHRWILAAVILSGCYDLDRLEHLYVPDSGHPHDAAVDAAHDAMVDAALPPDAAPPPYWNLEPGGSLAALHAIWGSGADDIWIAGDGVVLHGTGDGTWSNLTAIAPPGHWHSVWGSSANDFYLAGDVGIFHTTDGGSHWQSLLGASIEMLWGSGANDLYAVTQTNQVFRSADGLKFTAKTVSGSWWAVAGTSASDVFVVGGPGSLIMHSTGTDNWLSQSSNPAIVLYAIWGSAPNNVYAVGTHGFLMHNAGDGLWQPQQNENSDTNIAVWGSAANDVWVAGEGGSVQHSSDGKSWAKTESGTTAKLRAIWGTGPHDVYVVGDAGVILHHH
jgi:photosystem II stability/assembly factor-like uncharacterized protein